MNTTAVSDVEQVDRDAAAEWSFIECRHCSEYEGNFEADLAEAFARHRLAATRNAELVGVLERLTGALAKVSPIETNDTPDYAELTFGDHQTQAMTMQPNDWLAIEAAYLEARAALAHHGEV